MQAGNQMIKKMRILIALSLVLPAMFITAHPSAFAGWTAMNSGTSAYLQHVWGSSGNDVFAVGVTGTIVHYDGTNWSDMSVGGNALFNLWGTGGNDVFAVGATGTILHYDGTNWSSMSSGTSNYLEGVWGTSGSDVFVAGWNGTILRYNGSSWSSMNSGVTDSFYGIWGSSGNDIFAVGDKGAILHYNGTNWSPMTSGTTESLFDVWGSSATDVFAVGWGGTVIHYDGTSWSSMNSGMFSSSTCIWGSSATDVFAVSSSSIFHYDGSKWASMYNWALSGLTAVWGTSATDVFAVGDQGSILHYDGISTSTTTTAGSTTTIPAATTTTVTSATTTVSPTSHTIAGVVMGEVSDGVTVILEGDLNQATVTDPGGHYEFLDLPDGGFFIIRPELEGYEFDPPQHEIPALMNDELTIDFMSTLAPLCPTEVLYGEDSEEVALLRALRDEVLRKTPEGREIITQYYSISPLLVEAMKGDEEFKNEVEDIIDEVLMIIR
jgi:hypothetical protein